MLWRLECRSESLGHYRVFHWSAHSPGHLCNLTHICSLLDSQKHVRTFLIILCTPHSHQLFLSSVLASLLFALFLMPRCPGSSNVKQLPLIFLQQIHHGSGCSCWINSNQVKKDKPWEEDLPGNYQSGKIVTVVWDWGFGGAPAAAVLCRLLCYWLRCDCGMALKGPWSWGGGNGSRAN